MDKEIWLLRATHFGRIGFRLSIFSLVTVVILCLSTFISSMLFAVVAVIGIFLPLITFGLIFIWNPGYWSGLMSFLNEGNGFTTAISKIMSLVPYFSLLGCISSVIGGVLLMINKNEKDSGKFVFCIISFVLCLISTIIGFCDGLNGLV